MPIDRALDAIEAVMGRIFVNAETEAYDVFVDLNLSFTQARVLFMLSVCDDSLPISEIASRIALTPASTGRNVDQLVKLKLASRSEDPTDRRVKLVELTERGRKLAWAHHEAKREAVRTMLAALTTEQCDQIADALAPMSCQLPNQKKESPNA